MKTYRNLFGCMQTTTCLSFEGVETWKSLETSEYVAMGMCEAEKGLLIAFFPLSSLLFLHYFPCQNSWGRAGWKREIMLESHKLLQTACILGSGNAEVARASLGKEHAGGSLIGTSMKNPVELLPKALYKAGI